ncbi:MAG: DMT family transporter [Candidatus Peribacteraceae bacterium]|jgi:drug/metabolite transporter (DMT)-like permease|nr:DMT family transporter [Candidatus Peribacteraceae bacterium]|tara:strand:+ start:39540 stop:40493 length:954 start_codon:yes stop_codon:yes gene_type:complete
MTPKRDDSVQRWRLVQLLVAVVLANMKPILSKVLYEQGWTPVQLYFVILLVMTIVLMAHEIISLERGERWGMTKKDIKGTIFSTIIGGVIGPVMFFEGLNYVTATESLLLTSALPLFVVLFSVYFLKEKFSNQMAMGSVFLVIGMVVLLWKDVESLSLSTGAFLMIGSSMFSALTTIVHKKYIKHRHLDSIVMVRSFFSMIIVGGYILLRDPAGMEFLSTPQNVWAVLALPLLSFLVPFFLYFRALRKVKAMDAGIIAAMGRVIGIVMASSILGEVLTTNHLASLGLITLGVLFINVPLTKWRVVPSRLMELGPLRK